METTTEQTRFRALADQARAHLDDGYKIIAQLFEERAHEAFGLTWPAYFAQEFGEVMTKIRDVTIRREAVRRLTDAGMSQRQVAQATGASKSQVDRDLKAAPNGAPKPRPEPTSRDVRRGLSKNLDDALDKLYRVGLTSEDMKTEVAADLKLFRDRADALLERLNEHA